MIERALDHRLLRITIGTAIGVPLTAASLLGAIYGAVFFVGGLRKGELWAVSLGLVAFLGVLGVVGAWRRLLKPHSAMPSRERITVRRLLICGVISSAALAATTTYNEWLAGGVFFATLTAGGIAFVRGTPVAL